MSVATSGSRSGFRVGIDGSSIKIALEMQWYFLTKGHNYVIKQRGIVNVTLIA